MVGPRRSLEILADLRRLGVTERARELSRLRETQEAAERTYEACLAELHEHVVAEQTRRAREEQRLKGGLGTVADLEWSARYEDRARRTRARLEESVDRARSKAAAERALVAEAQRILSHALGERVAADELLARRAGEARLRRERATDEMVEDGARALRFDERRGGTS